MYLMTSSRPLDVEEIGPLPGPHRLGPDVLLVAVSEVLPLEIVFVHLTLIFVDTQM